MRLPLLAGALAVVLAGCTNAQTDNSVRQALQPGDYRIIVQDGRGAAPGHLSVINGRTGARERQLPLGVAAPDWSKLYTLDERGGRTVIRAIDVASGKSLQEASLDGRYEFPPVSLTGERGGLSPNGRWLALVRSSQGDQKHSSYLVFDTGFLRHARSVELDGDFRFDALSNDGASLYLEQDLANSYYSVRRYDLTAGLLNQQPVIDKTRGPGPMSGLRLHAVPSPDGQWLFSLYLSGPHGPFIHALNLRQGFAWCINLPATAKDNRDKQALWSLAVDPAGNTVFAVNAGIGLATQVSIGPNQPGIKRSVTLDTGQSATGFDVVNRSTRRTAGRAALTPDGSMLFAPAERGLVAIDTATLSVRGYHLQDRAIDGLALSPGGAWLYAVSPDRGQLLRVDPATGTMTEFSAAGAPVSLLAVS